MPKWCNLLDSFTYAFIQQTLPEYLLVRHCSAVNKEDKAPAVRNLHSGGLDKTLNKMNQQDLCSIYGGDKAWYSKKRAGKGGGAGTMAGREGHLGGGDLRKGATQKLGEGPSRRHRAVQGGA